MLSVDVDVFFWERYYIFTHEVNVTLYRPKLVIKGLCVY